MEGCGGRLFGYRLMFAVLLSVLVVFAVSEFPSLVMPDLRRGETDCCGDVRNRSV
mgnify:CR=1 FL=1